MESIRLFKDLTEEVTIKAPYVFSLKEKTYVPSKKSVTAATISVDGTVTEGNDETVQPNNEIWYTSTDGNVIQPYQTEGFDANIVSNVYENGKGIITFDAPLTKMDANDDGYGVFDADDSADIANRLTSISLPSSVTSIGDYTFSSCEGLTNIDIPSSVTTIGDGAIRGCRRLTSISLPSSVTSFGKDVFEECNNLTNIEIPSSVTSIGHSTFSGCYRLTTIDIPSGVTSIDRFAFHYCIGLTSVTFADDSQLTSIDYNAFYACSGLTSIEIPSSVTSIGEQAFYDCRSLTSIEIPSSVTNIGDKAFYGCTNITSITYKGVTYTSAGELRAAFTDNGVIFGFNVFYNTSLSE